MRILAPALGLWAMASGAVAQDVGVIEGVISDQLEAFNARDLESAWQHASPTIKGLFGTPETFGRMVEQGYPMVWDNRSAQFLEIRESAGAFWQKVLIQDAQGALHVLDYLMVETADGWQINAVQLLQGPEVGA